MKRHPALQPLSRDHHVALEVALVLRRATPDSAADAQRRFLEFWEQQGEQHLDVEDRALLGRLDDADAAIREIRARLTDEHARLRSLARTFATVDEGERTAVAHDLGQLLHDHVRYEEREAFPLLERVLSADTLAQLAADIAA